MAAPSLSQLRDIHLPDPISIWPPAPGWYAVAILILGGFAIIGYLAHRHWLKHRAKQLALQQLQQLEKQFQQTGRAALIISELSILLRRLALAYFPRTEVAGLHGDTWIQFLNTTTKSPLFNEQLATLLTTGPYKKHPPHQLQEMFGACRRWIRSAVR